MSPPEEQNEAESNEDDERIARAMRPHVSEARRRLNWALLLGSGGVIGAALGVPVVGLLLWPLRRREDAAWRRVGSVEDFADGDTVPVRHIDPQALPWAGFAATGGAFVRREGDAWVAFSSYCTHTGCPLRWEAGANLFLCPCHAGAFNRDGAVVSGPPPAPMDRLEIRVVDQEVQVRGTKVPLDAPERAPEQAKATGACPFENTRGRGA